MKKTFALIFTLVFLCSFITSEHETYLSVTDIEYNKEQKSLQIISRVFIDDFENVLSRRYHKDISLSYKKDLKANKDLIEKYINKKLSISIDGQELDLKLLGSKFDADQIVIFIEGANVQSFGKIKVQNLILTDLFDDQKNIVHVKKGKNIESMLLVKDNSCKTLNF